MSSPDNGFVIKPKRVVIAWYSKEFMMSTIMPFVDVCLCAM